MALPKTREELIEQDFLETTERFTRRAQGKDNYIFQYRKEYIDNLRVLVSTSAAIIGLLVSFRGKEIINIAVLGLTFILLSIVILLSLYDIRRKNIGDLKATIDEAERIDKLENIRRNKALDFITAKSEEKDNYYKIWLNSLDTNNEELRKQNKYSPEDKLTLTIYSMFTIAIFLLSFSVINWARWGEILKQFFNQ